MRRFFKSAGRWLLKRIYDRYERMLEAEILRNPLPEHVAIIMDGNRRFARLSNLSLEESYARGARKTRQVAEWCFALGIKQLTIYAFSIENFARPAEEREILFRLMREEFERVVYDEAIHRNNVRVKAIGNLKMLPEHVMNAIKLAERATAGYDRFRLFIAVAYSGRMEILDAARKIAEKVRRGEITPEEIDEDTISVHLYMCDDGMYEAATNSHAAADENAAATMRAANCDSARTESNMKMKTNVDLIIRTGGEKRLSNFVPWQSLGNECAAYFCTPFWPGFRRIDLLRAIRTYQQRREKNIKNANCLS